jgi:hypothetical protein
VLICQFGQSAKKITTNKKEKRNKAVLSDGLIPVG